MKKIARVISLFAMSAVSGCASIIVGNTQSVAIDTNPQKVSDCRISNEKGNWSVKSPGSTSLTKANGPLTVVCTSADGWSGTATAQSTTAGAAFGNIIAGGLIGAAVDMSSGAAYNYPAQIIVPIGAIASAQPAGG